MNALSIVSRSYWLMRPEVPEKSQRTLTGRSHSFCSVQGMRARSGLVIVDRRTAPSSGFSTAKCSSSPSGKRNEQAAGTDANKSRGIPPDGHDVEDIGREDDQKQHRNYEAPQKEALEISRYLGHLPVRTVWPPRQEARPDTDSQAASGDVRPVGLRRRRSADHAALLGAAGVVGAVEDEVAQGRELDLDPVQPGRGLSDERPCLTFGGDRKSSLMCLVRTLRRAAADTPSSGTDTVSTVASPVLAGSAAASHGTYSPLPPNARQGHSSDSPSPAARAPAEPVTPHGDPRTAHRHQPVPTPS